MSQTIRDPSDAKCNSSGSVANDDTIGAIVVGFLLLENFSLISFASAIEPLRIANKVTGNISFRYECFSVEGSDVRASNDVSLNVRKPFAATDSVDLLVICSSDNVEDVTLPKTTKASIRRFVYSQRPVVGICTGAFVLAELGLLNDRNCTIHWEYANAFRELFPAASLSDSIIQSDGKIITCAGGTAALDLMIGYVENTCGVDVAHKVAGIAMHHEVRQGDVPQNADARAESRWINAKVSKCISAMVASVEEPLSLDEVAQTAGISTRQMQRLFRQNLDISPRNYYRRVRLDAARQLVMRTDMPLVDIAISSGFANSSHFIKRYKQQFGTTPALERKAKVGAII